MNAIAQVQDVATLVTEASVQYVFVVDADLANVSGGGTSTGYF